MSLVGPVLPALPARRRPVVRLWLPLTPLWLVLAPIVLALAPLVLLVPACRGLNPYRAAWIVGGVLLNLAGTEVQVESPAALVRVRIL